MLQSDNFAFNDNVRTFARAKFFVTPLSSMNEKTLRKYSIQTKGFVQKMKKAEALA